MMITGKIVVTTLKTSNPFGIKWMMRCLAVMMILVVKKLNRKVMTMNHISGAPHITSMNIKVSRWWWCIRAVNQCAAPYNLQKWKVTRGLLVMVMVMVNKGSESYNLLQKWKVTKRDIWVIHLFNYCTRYNVEKSHYKLCFKILHGSELPPQQRIFLQWIHKNTWCCVVVVVVRGKSGCSGASKDHQ